MIKLCRTWLIFLFLNFSKVVFNEIYFPIMSIKRYHSGIWHHCYCCSMPTKCSLHSGYCHTCALRLLCNSNTWILQIWGKDIHLPFASPSSGFQQRMWYCQNHKWLFTHSFIKDLRSMAIYIRMDALECGYHFPSENDQVWQISHFNKSVIVQIHEHRNAKSNIWLNYTSNSLETSEFFGIFWSSLQQATLEKVHISIGNNISLNSYYHMWYVVHYKNIMYLRHDIHILLPCLYMGFNQMEIKHV